MTKANAIKKLNKITDKIIENSGKTFAYYNGQVISFWTQEVFGEEEIVCIRTGYADLKDDSMTDLYLGTYHNTITAAIKHINK